jgi:cell filamentation protein
MYDAVRDPYTYENSTVLVNKLDLRAQLELEAFEAEISNARADEPLPEGELDFTLYKGGHPFRFRENIEGQAMATSVS